VWQRRREIHFSNRNLDRFEDREKRESDSRKMKKGREVERDKNNGERESKRGKREKIEGEMKNCFCNK